MPHFSMSPNCANSCYKHTYIKISGNILKVIDQNERERKKNDSKETTKKKKYQNDRKSVELKRWQRT